MPTLRLTKKDVLWQNRIRNKPRLKQINNQRFTVIGLLDATKLRDAQIITIFCISAELLKSVKKDLKAAPLKIARLKTTLSAEKIAQQLNLPVNWVEKQLSQA